MALPIITPAIINGMTSVVSSAVSSDTPDRSRLRVKAQDPSKKIDAPEETKILSFPVDRPKYFISFAFEEYRRPSMFEGLSSKGLTDYISLPMPNNLIDANIFNYNNEEGDLLIDVAAQNWENVRDRYKTGGINAAVKGAGNEIASAGSAMVGRGLQEIYRSTTSGDGALSTAVKGGLQIAGLADNPFMTVMFKGVNFKTHKFGWRLSPRSIEETNAIYNIVNTFKKSAHPEILSATFAGFYKFPNIVWPKFNPENTRKHMYKFKPCVITAIVANWSPNDRPSFFSETEAPIEMTLEIELQEIELWRKAEGASGDFNDIQTPPVRNLGSI